MLDGIALSPLASPCTARNRMATVRDDAGVAVDGQLLETRGVGKSFYGIPALADIDLALAAGEVHGLVGENGAGKSTFMKILAGVHQRDTGEIHLDGDPVAFHHPAQAYAAGISTVFQEFNLLPERSVAENVFLGHEPRVRGL